MRGCLSSADTEEGAGTNSSGSAREVRIFELGRRREGRRHDTAVHAVGLREKCERLFGLSRR